MSNKSATAGNKKQISSGGAYIPPHLRNKQLSVFDLSIKPKEKRNPVGDASNNNESTANTCDDEDNHHSVNKKLKDNHNCSSDSNDNLVVMDCSTSSVNDHSSVDEEDSMVTHHDNNNNNNNNNNVNNSFSQNTQNNSGRHNDFSVEMDDSSNNSEKAMKCSILISGFPSELPDHAKENMLQPFYKLGGRSKWVLGNKVVVVFLNENVAEKSLRIAKNSLLRTELLSKVCKQCDDDTINGK